MSVLGVGTDIVAVARVNDLLEKHGERFLARCFSRSERELLAGKTAAARAPWVAARWAAKEAFLKALGGVIAHIPYHEISVESRVGGAPWVRVTGMAALALRERGGHSIHVSLSHEAAFAVAVVVIEV